ncbi:MAG: enoyl-CoA hydratase-related protein [Anaerolineae bacterium]|nr:enoyl-CoA hydratase-related protein [Anaerolineae bacterium]MDW8068133.1 enoyl-CoA hydratase-related protein [Anaerolineae bacterium]
MGNWQYIRTEIEDRIATLTIDHPPVNSFNRQVVAELEEAIDELLANDEVKAIVITGGGTNAFVAGADIPEIKNLLDNPGENYAASREFIEKGQRLFLKIERATKPVIAAINGFCLGGGLELAMACHMRVCSDRARLGQPEINLGIIPGWGGTQRLSRIVGKGKAIELILTGDMITAQEAYRLNLVNKVVPAGAVLKEARDLARKIVSKSKFPIAAALRAITQGMELPLEEGLRLEAEQFVSLAETEDIREGINAFLEKRQPQFKDR